MPNQHIWKQRDTKKIQQEKWKVWKKNTGLTGRRIKDSKPFELYGRLHTDISFQNRYIINNVDIVLRLIRNPSSFCLMGDANHNYELFIYE
jgi:hypothetical protein